MTGTKDRLPADTKNYFCSSVENKIKSIGLMTDDMDWKD
jgi:hypothetical protein